jgi:hypothetical protein
MAGSPKKRARQEQAALKELQLKGQAVNREEAAKLPRVRYTPEMARNACDLIVSGLPIEDSVLNGIVIAQGVATTLKIHPSTFWDWQKEHKEFAESIARAREESAHRIADRIQQLADVALKDPAMANSVRVAADILKWSAMVRNRKEFGDKFEHTVKGDSFVAWLDRIAKMDKGNEVGEERVTASG